MAYVAPELVRIGRANNVVLGINPGNLDNNPDPIYDPVRFETEDVPSGSEW